MARSTTDTATDTPSASKIEILPVSLLEMGRGLVGEFRRTACRFNLRMGWHYPLDLSWAAMQLDVLDARPGMRVLEAGAGYGIMQWWLAGRGVDVVSADRIDRRALPLRFRRLCRVRGLREGDLKSPALTPRDFVPSRSPGCEEPYLSRLFGLLGLALTPRIPEDCGTVFIYNGSLESMPDVPDESVDAVVSISALEHNTFDGLRECVAELMRVLKPGGRLVATLGAAKDEDWLHEPSKGWCYTDSTLRRLFDLPPDTPSNYDRYDELLEALQNCAELRDKLDPVYSRSGEGGMPWGIWEPRYPPVGVCKVKAAR